VKNPFRKKIGLVLGGGAAKGIAHIGVLKVLEENKIIPDMISGTSMGALIGAAYALEPDAKKLEKTSIDFKITRKIDLQFPKHGLIKGDKIEKWLRELYQERTFKDTKIPLFITATDLLQKQKIIFNEGDIAKAVRASISIPGIFNPVVNNDKILVDGGVLNNLPTQILRKMGAEIIITVNPIESPSSKFVFEKASKTNKNKKLPNLLYNLGMSIQLLQSNIHEIELAKKTSDVFIQISSPNVNLYDFQKQEEIITEGEKQARKHLPEIKKLKKFQLKDLLFNKKNSYRMV
jgi:NTE family protein